MIANESAFRGWSDLPHEVLCMIFELLAHNELAVCECVCQNWREVARSNLIWKRRCIHDFGISPHDSVPNMPIWKEEYRRMNNLVPRFEVKSILEHKDEVFHISFSHDGSLFCTCSKDATLKVFEASYPFDLVHSENFGYSTIFQWRYTQYSDFNKSDTKLLVSGASSGSKIKGEIAIYAVLGTTFTLGIRVPLAPFDAMGAWVDDLHIITAHDRDIVLVALEESSPGAYTFSFQNVCFSSSHNLLSYLQVCDMTAVICKKLNAPEIHNHEQMHEMHTVALSTVCDDDSSKISHSCDSKNGMMMNGRYRLLLCFTGDLPNAFHQIGIKVLPQINAMQKPQRYRSQRLRERLEGSWGCGTGSWDHIIELRGQCLGMAISPCNRYLCVNVRKWVLDLGPTWHDKTIDTGITTRMFDLLTMTEVKSFTGHRAFSNDIIYFINVSCHRYYVVSGAENNAGYLWDRHHNILLSTFPHKKVVNCVALNPRCEEMAVTGSDDHSIKVWQSKSWLRENKLTAPC